MDPYTSYAIQHPTAGEETAMTLGITLPVILTVIVIAYRFIFGRWPHPGITVLGIPLTFMLSGLAWMFLSMNPSPGEPGTTGQAIHFTAGAIIGSGAYGIVLALVAALAWTSEQTTRGNRRGSRRTEEAAS